jgi:hypothetical protein
MPEDAHGWLTTETLSTRFGNYEFRGGYPVGDAGARLLEQLRLNRAVEVYLTQLMPVGQFAAIVGLREFAGPTAQHVVVWPQLMDSATLILTANCETVYALAQFDLAGDGPTVVDAPPRMLGVAQDGLQRYLVDIGMVGPDKGAGGRYLFLPPGYSGEVPDGFSWCARPPSRC